MAYDLTPRSNECRMRQRLIQSIPRPAFTDILGVTIERFVLNDIKGHIVVAFEEVDTKVVPPYGRSEAARPDASPTTYSARWP